MDKIYDPTQRAVIDFCGSRALVLAAPGCGKTEILSQRILKAHSDYGVPYSDMLCVTFTNRASREMRFRVESVVGDSAADVFVGNLHRFCMSFLFDNAIVSRSTSVIDDADQSAILANLAGRALTPSDIKGVIDYSSRKFEIENNFPQGLHIHSNASSYAALGEAYVDYKNKNNCIDFDDILLLSYKALAADKYKHLLHSSYNWIQVDEVQDLNPLQIAIVELLIADSQSTVVYLGDERQSIYSFLGANSQNILSISQKCKGNIFSLSNNYRSPVYLLDMLNDYAHSVLKIDKRNLPTAVGNQHLDDALLAVSCHSVESQYSIVAKLVDNIRRQYPAENIGVLVRTNAQVVRASDALTQQDIAHLALTNADIFKTDAFKTLCSHFSVVVSETATSDWVRIFQSVKVFDSPDHTRRCLTKMRSLALCPTDLLNYEGSSYVAEFCSSFLSVDAEIVIFDTETTGLNIFEDDIIQIAALKVRGGHIVPGSELDIIIATDKPIPKTLKHDMPNPMVAEYARRAVGERSQPYEKFFDSPQDAFCFFADYVGNRQLLGHNVNFDIHILEANIRRRTVGVAPPSAIVWDTLKLSRLSDPDLNSHTLENLLAVYHLEGINSHNAIDDIRATHSVAVYLAHKLSAKVAEQQAFLSHSVMLRARRKLSENYGMLYSSTVRKVYSFDDNNPHPFIDEFVNVYNSLLVGGYIEPIPRFDYMCQLFESVVFCHPSERRFADQLFAHLYDLRTFNESDLYQNDIIRESVHVMTIHKSKGLEFDNVIICNVSEGVFPHFSTRRPDEDAKVLYVAMSRARQRVYITFVGRPSPFLSDDSVKTHFDYLSEDEVSSLLA